MRKARSQDSSRESGGSAVNRLLVRYTFAAWLGFLSIGIPLPVLSLFVHDGLGYNPLVVGIVIGSQSLATLVSRQFAGRMCDLRGPKPTTLLGLAISSVSGLCYLLANGLSATPPLALAVLLVGRLLLGIGESMFITALAAWSVARVGGAHAGRAMAWSGIAMYAALAFGAPVGVALYQAGGFAAVACFGVAMPLLGAGVAMLLKPVAVPAPPPTSYLTVLRRIWAPGLGMALASSGIGTISAFLTLYFAAMKWSGAGQALMAFGLAYIVMRLLFGGLPDKMGGTATALASLAVEAIGLLTIWLAPSPLVAIAGAALTGLGYSLVFPSRESKRSNAPPRTAEVSCWGRIWRASIWDWRLPVHGQAASRKPPGWMPYSLPPRRPPSSLLY